MFQQIQSKIFLLEGLKTQVDLWKKADQKVVFTNGCFDLIHLGHLQYLAEARSLGDHLIVAVNSDASVKQLKGESRPIKNDLTRSTLLASLQYVDAVIIFDNPTPLDLIRNLKPNILVKGGDWKIDQIVGAENVLQNGGKVHSLSFLKGQSSSGIIDRILGGKTKS